MEPVPLKELQLEIKRVQLLQQNKKAATAILLGIQLQLAGSVEYTTPTSIQIECDTSSNESK